MDVLLPIPIHFSSNLYAQIPDQINQFDENSIKAQSEQTEYISSYQIYGKSIDVELLNESWMSIFDWFSKKKNNNFKFYSKKQTIVVEV